MPTDVLTVEESGLQSPDSSFGKEWENLLHACPESGFMQSLHWAQFKAICEQKVIHVSVRNASELLAGALLYTSVDEKRPTVLLSPYGPVLPWQDQSLARDCLSRIISKTNEIARALNAVTLRIEPRIHFPQPPLLREFAQAPVNLIPAETMILDLSLSDETLLQAMKAKCRYNIGLASKNGLVVEELIAEASTVEIVFEMLHEASVRDKFFLEPYEFFDKLIMTLVPSQFLRVFVAKHDNEALGVLLLVCSGKQATYLYGGISNKKRNLMVGYALQWKAIQSARSAGCTSYDFYGYDKFQNPNHSYAKFSRFKSGFGGVAERFIGAQDYMFMDKLVDNVIDFFRDIQ